METNLKSLRLDAPPSADGVHLEPLLSARTQIALPESCVQVLVDFQKLASCRQTPALFRVSRDNERFLWSATMKPLGMLGR